MVWSLEPSLFCPAEQAPPALVNPSCGGTSRLNMKHGLFEVVPGVNQVRGLDIANMTLNRGRTKASQRGRPLTSTEGARAALDSIPRA